MTLDVVTAGKSQRSGLRRHHGEVPVTCKKGSLRTESGIKMGDPRSSIQSQAASRPEQMEGEQPNEATTPEAENEHLRRAITLLVAENKKQVVGLAGIRGLVRQLHHKRTECESLTARCERLEGSLARAENRIAQLSHMAAKNGEPSQGAIVVPGVSKKILENLTRENTKLRQALNHVSDGRPCGVDLAVQNLELHHIIITLRSERDAMREETNDLKSLLATIREGNTEAVDVKAARLIEQITRLKMHLDAKQAFCEDVVSENEALKEELQSQEGEKIVDVRRMKGAIKDVAQTLPMIREIMEQTWDGEDDNETLREEDAAKLAAELETGADDLRRRVGDETEKLTNELRETRESRDHLEDELQKAKDAAEESAAQVDTLRQQLADLHESTETVNRDHNELEGKLKELQNEHQLMQMALVTYETDFKKERTEKCRAERDRDDLQKDRGRVKAEYERLKNDYLAFRQCVQQMHASPSTPSYPTRRQGSELPGVNAPPMRSVQKSNELQCPVCKRMFPCNWLEDHMRDCNE